MDAEELEKLSDDDLFDEIREVVNYSRNRGHVGSAATAFRARCRAIGAEMKRRGWQKEQTPYYSLFQPPEL
jgi:hypothetical protein